MQYKVTVLPSVKGENITKECDSKKTNLICKNLMKLYQNFALFFLIPSVIVAFWYVN
jgi:hypothetical protein